MVSDVPCGVLLLCQDSYVNPTFLSNSHDTTFVSPCKAFVSHMVKHWLSLVISMVYMRFQLDIICDTRDFYGISEETLENTRVLISFHM